MDLSHSLGRAKQRSQDREILESNMENLRKGTIHVRLGGGGSRTCRQGVVMLQKSAELVHRRPAAGSPLPLLSPLPVIAAEEVETVTDGAATLHLCSFALAGFQRRLFPSTTTTFPSSSSSPSLFLAAPRKSKGRRPPSLVVVICRLRRLVHPSN
ncbi:unnamed protein product [Victoria cruziana]